jgi:membrane protease YdiL (CAAX protease family)
MMRYEKNNWKRLGWERKDSRLELLLWGFGVAFLFLILFSCLQAAFGSKKFLFQNLDQLTQKAFFYLLGVFVVGVLEEFLFRGVLFGVLRDRISTARALFWTSFIYAAVHFLRTNDSMNVAHPTMMDSFKVLATLVEPFSQPQLIWQSFVGLFLLGLVLNHLFLKTNSLWVAIGLHSGAVFFLKLKKFFLVDASQNWLCVWGTSRFYDGFLGWGVLIVMWVVLIVCLRKRQLLVQ